MLTARFSPSERRALCATCLLAKSMRDCPRCAFYQGPAGAPEKTAAQKLLTTVPLVQINGRASLTAQEIQK